jgi:hypothetical protein
MGDAYPSSLGSTSAPEAKTLAPRARQKCRFAWRRTASRRPLERPWTRSGLGVSVDRRREPVECAREQVIYHLFVCHRSAGSEAAPPLDELAGRGALEQLPEDRGRGYETLLIDMRPTRVEQLLPRLVDPSG